jgi:hypothetical protein
MIYFVRRPHVESWWCKTSMFVGGNAGMVVGMLLGGWLGANVETSSVPVAALVSFASMTAGMAGGMLIGTALACGASKLAAGSGSCLHNSIDVPLGIYRGARTYRAQG